MSDIIQEERESIRKDNNIAQTTLEDIVFGLKKDIVDLNIQTPLFGDLDLSVLSKKFPRLRHISFGEGKITSINHLPVGITKLVCKGNLLVSLDQLPGSLIYLDIDDNFLSTLDCSTFPQLEELHCENNHLEEIQNLPKSLTRLYCTRNQLHQLDLSNLIHLRVLHCSENPLLSIDNLPETIHEFVFENNPLTTEITNYDYVDWEHEDEFRERYDRMERANVVKRNISYHDALKTYFRLKHDYENDLLKRRRVAFKKSKSRKNGSLRAKRIRGKCVHCKREVGTTFNTDSNGYYAYCGDVSQPCSLDIKLLRGQFSPNEQFLYLFREQIEKEKDGIICQKMDSLFNYISEETAVRDFKQVLQTYKETSELFHEFFDRHQETFYNTKRQDLLKEKKMKIQEIQAQIHEIIDEYKRSGNLLANASYGGVTGLLKSAMEIHVRDLIPEIENLRRLKYEIMEINDNVLFQREVGLNKTEYTFGDPPTVVRFRGV
jgi:hypothetical protein